MKIIDKMVKPINVRSRLLSQNKKTKQIMNINMKTVKLKFLNRALVLVNAYKCANFQNLGSVRLPSLKLVGLRVQKIRRIVVTLWTCYGAL